MATQLSQTSLLMQLAGTSNTKTSSTFGGLLSTGNGSQSSDISGFSGFSSLMSDYSMSAELVAAGTLSSDGSGFDMASMEGLAALANKLGVGGNTLPLEGASLPDQLAALTNSLSGWQTMLGGNNKASAGDMGLTDMMPANASALLSLMSNVEQQAAMTSTSLSSVFETLNKKLSDTLDTLRAVAESFGVQAGESSNSAEGLADNTNLLKTFDSAGSAFASAGTTDATVISLLDTPMSEQLIAKLEGLLDDIEKITGERAGVDDSDATMPTNLVVQTGTSSLDTPREVIGLMEQLVAQLKRASADSSGAPVAEEWYDLSLSESPLSSQTASGLDSLLSSEPLQNNTGPITVSPLDIQTADTRLQEAAQSELLAQMASSDKVKQSLTPEVLPAAVAGIDPESEAAAAVVTANMLNQVSGKNENKTNDGLAARSGSAAETVLMAGRENSVAQPSTGVNLSNPAAQAGAANDVVVDKSMNALNVSAQGSMAEEGAEVARRSEALSDTASTASVKERNDAGLSSLSQATSVLNRTSSPVQMNMPAGMNPGQPGWSEAMSERVVWASNQRIQTATLQLDPPELGSLQVKLHITNDQVSVTFSSPHASVRDSVEQSMPRLKEMLEEQGLSLGDSSVNDQSASSSDRDGSNQKSVAKDDGDYGSSRDGSEEVSDIENKSSVSLVDYYA